MKIITGYTEEGEPIWRQTTAEEELEDILLEYEALAKERRERWEEDQINDPTNEP